MRVAVSGKVEEGIESEINKIVMTENGTWELSAIMPEGDYWLGETARFKVVTQSERFDLCVPIQALHEGSDKRYYIFVTREQEEILGTELVADQVEVDIIDKNDSTAAVEGALSSKENVIVDSSKYINDGDRVRVN